MKHLKPLARFVYASAFFIPFLWAATSRADLETDGNIVTDIKTAADIVALADLDGASE